MKEKPAAAKPQSDSFKAIYQSVAQFPRPVPFAFLPEEILGTALPVGSINDQLLSLLQLIRAVVCG